MPVYEYKGVNAQGKNVKSTLLCDDEIDLKTRLREKGITLISFKVGKEKRRSNFLAASSRVSPNEFITFCREFAIMITAGATILECLDTLRKQKFGTIFKNTISDVYEDVLKGVALSTAFRKRNKYFPDFFCSMVYVGELSGTLPQTLVRAADYFKRRRKTQNELRSALVYPMFILVVIVAVVVMLMVVVIPQFTETFNDFQLELPGITIIMMNISDFFVQYWYYLIGGIVGLILLIWLFGKTKTGKRINDRITWRLPLLGKLKKASVVSSFSSSFAIMLNSGLPLIDCMNAMGGIVTNSYFNEKFKYAIDQVNNGRSLYRSLDNTGIFPPMLIEMVQVGESSSELGKVFDVLAEYYEEAQSNATKRFLSVLEPILIVIMGVLVVLVLLSVYLPMFSLYTGIV